MLQCDLSEFRIARRGRLRLAACASSWKSSVKSNYAPSSSPHPSSVSSFSSLWSDATTSWAQAAAGEQSRETNTVESTNRMQPYAVLGVSGVNSYAGFARNAQESRAPTVRPGAVDATHTCRTSTGLLVRYVPMELSYEQMYSDVVNWRVREVLPTSGAPTTSTR